MDNLIENAPKIIGEAAKSPLGLFALMILVLAVLGFFFFRQASERARIAMFVLMFVGVASFGAAIFRATPHSPGGSPNPQDNRKSEAKDCFEQYFSDIPKERMTTLEEGTLDQQLIGPHQSKHEAIAIKFTENNRLIGAIRFSFYSNGNIFKVETAIDFNCQPIEEYKNANRGGDKHVLQNWDSLEIEFGDHTYSLGLEYVEGRIDADFKRITPN
ncbi:hypothetical protein L0337_18910 [candidate division KSB1 bacterium]|nr:hypothetical protein [candidate division KSB1 bacterium]